MRTNESYYGHRRGQCTIRARSSCMRTQTLRISSPEHPGDSLCRAGSTKELRSPNLLLGQSFVNINCLLSVKIRLCLPVHVFSLSPAAETPVHRSQAPRLHQNLADNPLGSSLLPTLHTTSRLPPLRNTFSRGLNPGRKHAFLPRPFVHREQSGDYES